MKNDTMITTEFVGILKEFCLAFVSLKRASGLRYSTESGILKRFDAFSREFVVPPGTLTKELVLAWCEKRMHESAKTHSARVLVIRHFATYLLQMGCDAYVPNLAAKYNFGQMRFRAHVFSAAELKRIFNQIDNMSPTNYSPHKHIIMPVMFRLFYCCGLRLSEAVNLKHTNADLQLGILAIRDTKFGKSRLVPMEKNLTEMCREYHHKITQFYPDNEYFFLHVGEGNIIQRAFIPYSGKRIRMQGIHMVGEAKEHVYTISDIHLRFNV